MKLNRQSLMIQFLNKKEENVMFQIGLDFKVEDGKKVIFVKEVTVCCTKMAESFFTTKKFEVKGVGPSAYGIIPSLRLTEDMDKGETIFHYCPYCGSPVTYTDSKTGSIVSTWTEMKGGLRREVKTPLDVEVSRNLYIWHDIKYKGGNR